MNVRCPNCFEVFSGEYRACPHCGYAQGGAPKELYHLHPGMALGAGGRYLVGQVLGFGGFGVTYKVWDKNLGTVMAVKEYYPAGIVNRIPGQKSVNVYAQKRRGEYEHGLMRFLDEARITAQFSSHKNIINIFDYFEENGTAYFVMEYLDGITLSQYLKTDEPDVAACLEITSQVCAALRDVHKAGIVHRDISPDNIFLCNGGGVKVIDFGAARFSADEDSQLTIILKPGFAPPEQYERVNEQGPWTDIYALGATLYYMATGQKPEESTNRRVQDDLVPPMQRNPDIPEHLNNAILKAMAVDRHLRFAGCADFEQAILGEKRVFTPQAEKKKRSHRRLAAVLACVLAVTVGLGLFAARYHENKEAETLPDCSLVMAYIDDGDSAKKTAYEEIIKSFNESFPNVTITLEPFEDGDYGALSPNLFESTGLGGGQDLSGLFGDLDKKPYYALPDMQLGKQFPLGFTAPVVYVNSTIASPGDVIAANAGNDKAAFLDGTDGTYFGTTADYQEIQKALPGRYALVAPDSAAATFTDLWSIGEYTKDQQKAAARLLEYMLSERAQDLLFIQRRCGAVPLNRNSVKAFCDVYTDFEGFFQGAGDWDYEIAG